jgi:hypothetical protein
MPSLDVFPFLFEISDHLFLLGELFLYERAKSLCLSFEASLQFHKTLLVLDVERLPEQICYQSIHKSGLVLEVSCERPELPVNVDHLVIYEIESAPTQAVKASIRHRRRGGYEYAL